MVDILESTATTWMVPLPGKIRSIEWSEDSSGEVYVCRVRWDVPEQRGERRSYYPVRTTSFEGRHRALYRADVLFSAWPPSAVRQVPQVEDTEG